MPGKGKREQNQMIPVGVLGATGSVGQKFVSLLADHPWFRLTALTASDRSAGKKYAEAVRWVQTTPLPGPIAEMPVLPTRPPIDCRLVFSALDAAAAGPLELEFARVGCLVVSNAQSHRMDPDVPLLIPEVNPDHLQLVSNQSFGPGAILTNPNCSTIGLVLALKPLHDRFGIRSLNVVTLQARPGAGLPGLAGMEINDNVIPFIEGEEEKIERETRKILGRLKNGRIREAEIVISAQCNRVPVIDGHTECVSIGLEKPASLNAVRESWEGFVSTPQQLRLPSAPAKPIHYQADDRHPQPRLHRNLEKGMAVSVGRLRDCPILDLKFVILSHNTIRGAAVGAILAAELAVSQGLVRNPDVGSKPRP